MRQGRGDGGARGLAVPQVPGPALLLISAERRFLLLLARRIAPGTARLDAAGQERFFSLIEGFLASRPAGVRAQIGLFLKVLRWLPALRYGGPLDRLPPEAQDAALRWFQDCPVSLLRKGFWGVRTLVYLGYYGRPEAWESFAYRPSRSGNDLLRHA